MTHRQAIDKAPTSTLQRYLTAALIVLFICLLLPVGAVATKWTPVNSDIEERITALDRALQADSMRSNPRIPSELNRLRSQASQSMLRAAEIQAAYWAAEAAYANEGSADQVRHILDQIGPVDSVAMPYEWFRIQYLRLKLLLYIEKDYPAAYKLCEKLMISAQEWDMPREEAKLVANQGLLFYGIEDYEEALKIQHKAQQCFSNLGMPADSLRNELNICNTLAALGNVDETVRRLKMIERDTTVHRHHDLYCNVLMSLYHFTHDGAYAQRSLDESRLSEDSILIMKSLQNMTNIYYQEGDTARCLDIQKEVFRFFRLRQDPDMIVPLKGIVDIYGHENSRDSVLKYLNYLVAAQDSFSRVQNTAIISRLRSHNEILGLKDKILLSEARASLERTRSIMLGIICVVLLLLGAAVAFYLRRRAKTEQKMKELENDRLAVSLQNERLQNEHFQQTISNRERELTSKALQLLNKNELLNDLIEQIHQLGLPAAQENTLVRKISEHLNGEKSWDDFTAHFEQVNPQFFKTLKERYPALTDKDLKICAYIKMGFSAKQIAQMLSVLPESVNTTRYRLRRKMALPPDISIEDHLREI